MSAVAGGSVGLLDHIIWRSLSGTQAPFSSGTSQARRYAPGFSPIIAFADAARPDFAALEPYCEPGEHFYCLARSGAAPAGWQIDGETTLLSMLWAGAAPASDELPGAVRLDTQHVPQMLELVALTRPGPYGPRNIELGEYFGCFEGPRLVAMAGERLCAGPLREISAVCTHPDFRGRGLSRGLMALLIRREMARGETPFLHVTAGNTEARRLYQRMGFERHAEMHAQVLSRKPR